MKVVVQRCSSASVSVEGAPVGSIGHGLMLLVGITHEDSEADISWMADKIANLRIFEDGAGKMNLSVLDSGGAVLSVSQFTLYGDCRKGRRPNFMSAARPEHAEPLYEAFNGALRALGLQVETGRFGAMMDVSLVNEGPVTLLVDSRE
ncbi:MULTISPECIES: D-aminoacyl-tRNA deacylase [unclassified Paenibacillus]|uniref:D-aminoacyl-tRNA deacylase n=1 Tax=unclassified Paenibacillus TaxID=185978 RepID=UPI000956157C|nr:MULTISPECIES: D-aminoacyl-tRNA deacylase [unclassified Paenibacillus]ASS66291.1 D-tyrosyl-tRNA(Tyr) deacylase [Paenibacillus sp. RUD330]SIQ08847.1 D-tyrosyl-tRNA(Tyr) deacylase [Paenibacillus sp. RU4X]SIQ29020.1 D-tyrosyl-tRNA(Tyr) deacylase [Paenibacillus sp. RU4T]